MKKIMFVGIGGFLGAMLRYYIKSFHMNYNLNYNFPINTFVINILGTFVLALILTIAFEIWKIDEAVRLGIATGFLGAFTTFSTMCKETINLIYKEDYFSASLYTALSVTIGLVAVYFGIALAREVISKLFKLENDISIDYEGDFLE